MRETTVGKSATNDNPGDYLHTPIESEVDLENSRAPKYCQLRLPLMLLFLASASNCPRFS